MDGISNTFNHSSNSFHQLEANDGTLPQKQKHWWNLNLIGRLKHRARYVEQFAEQCEVDVSLNYKTLRFKNKEIEGAYQEHIFSGGSEKSTVAGIVVSAFYYTLRGCLNIYSDISIATEMDALAWYNVISRGGTVLLNVVSLLLFLFFAFRKRSKTTANQRLFLKIWLIAFIFLTGISFVLRPLYGDNCLDIKLALPFLTVIAAATLKPVGFGAISWILLSTMLLSLLLALTKEPFTPNLDLRLASVVYYAITAVILSCIMYVREFNSRLYFSMLWLLWREKRKSMDVLHSMLPPDIVNELHKDTPERKLMKSLPEVTVMFADIANFETISARLSPKEVVELLNSLYVAFDALAEKYNVLKVESVGSVYMAAAGRELPVQSTPEAIVRMALEMIELAKVHQPINDEPLRIRIGLHSGPVVAGVVGLKKYAYHLFGDTVNTSARMQSYCPPMHIQVSQATHDLIKDSFATLDKGEVIMKGKGPMKVYWVQSYTGCLASDEDVQEQEHKRMESAIVTLQHEMNEAAKMNPYTLRFKDKETEREITQQQCKKNMQAFRLASLVIMIVFPCIGMYEFVAEGAICNPSNPKFVSNLKPAVEGVLVRSFLQVIPCIVLLSISHTRIAWFTRWSSIYISVAFACIGLSTSMLDMFVFKPFLYTIITNFFHLSFMYYAPVILVDATIATSMILTIYIEKDTIVSLNLVLLLYVSGALLCFVGYQGEQTTKQIVLITKTLQREVEKGSLLLSELLPPEISMQLKRRKRLIADYHYCVSVLFLDIVGFTSLASHMPPEEVTLLLDKVYSEFDKLSVMYDTYKIDTIGDAYVCCTGLLKQGTETSEKRIADDAKSLVTMGLHMVKVVSEISKELASPIEVRIGIHTGPCSAGVIGTKNFRYSIWGMAFTKSEQLQAKCIPNNVHIAQTTRSWLSADDFEFEELRVMDQPTYLVHPRPEIYSPENESPPTPIQLSSQTSTDSFELSL